VTTIGYALSSEEHAPRDLVRYAGLEEEAGFEFAVVSDHFHPWTDRQGQSPFVWPVIGAIAATTDTLRLGTGVTCPTHRIHPAIVAHAGATAAAMMPGRFFLGVGTREQLNEHVLGQQWPGVVVRREMLREAIEVVRLLWSGDLVSHSGLHFTVENARLYTVPEEPIELFVAAGGEEAAKLAGEIGDGIIGAAPQAALIEAFDAAGGEGQPRYGQLTVCWAESERHPRRLAHEVWPNAALAGDIGQELPLPCHFEEAATMVTEQDVADSVVCGPDVDTHLAAIGKFVDAGFDHVYVHQVGPEQEAFIRFYESEVLAGATARPVS
jgi:coenzyme F420-dependent glucose-6-phosphate dehydrogenase